MAPSESMQIHLTYNNISEIPTIPDSMSQVKSKYQSNNNLTEQKIEIMIDGENNSLKKNLL